MPIFQHPPSASRLADVSPMASQRRARGPRRNLSPRQPRTRRTLPYQLIAPIFHYVLRKIPLRTSMAVDDSLLRDPRRSPSAFSSSSSFSVLSIVTGSNVTEDRKSFPQMFDAPLSKEDATTTTTAEEKERDASAAPRFDIPDVYSDDERRNTAMRREACPRSCSTLRSSGLSNAFADVRADVCGHGMMM